MEFKEAFIEILKIGSDSVLNDKRTIAFLEECYAFEKSPLYRSILEDIINRNIGEVIANAFFQKVHNKNRSFWDAIKRELLFKLRYDYAVLKPFIDDFEYALTCYIKESDSDICVKKCVTKVTLPSFQGKENVIHLIYDNGTETWLTQKRSFGDEAYATQACKLNTVENENRHVHMLFLFNSKDEEVGRYYLGKHLYGKSPSGLVEIKERLEFFERWNPESNSWEPCVDIMESSQPHPVKNSSYVGQKCDIRDCVIRRSILNGEHILEVHQNNGTLFYYKNIRTLGEVDESSEGGLAMTQTKEGHVKIVIDGHFYQLEKKICTYTINDLINNLDSLIVCSISSNRVDWTDYIKAGNVLRMISNNPISFVSNKRVVTQDPHHRWAVFDMYGNFVVPYGKYIQIDGYNRNLARVLKYNHVMNPATGEQIDCYKTWGIIDKEGKEIVECEYDQIYKFYGKDNWFTILRKGRISTKFHLGYWKTFADISDVEWLQYLEERGSVEWKGGNRNGQTSYKHCEDEICNDSCDQYDIWDALDG